MRRKRFTEKQSIGILKEAEGGHEESRCLPAARHQRVDVLPREGEVRQARGQ